MRGPMRNGAVFTECCCRGAWLMKIPANFVLWRMIACFAWRCRFREGESSTCASSPFKGNICTIIMLFSGSFIGSYSLKMECALFVIVQYDSSLQFNLLNSVTLLIRFGVKLVVTIITYGFKTVIYTVHQSIIA